MKTSNLQQGTPEWHAHRATHDNASEAPAMMNCSPYETRADLIKRRATGIKPEVDAGQQKRFDDGHRFEALCRKHAEEIIGQQLYPVTGSEDDGKLSASFDGLTMDESIGYEHKTLNAQLRQVMVEGATGADLPLMYRVQMEQQCMVSGAATILFMASKWQNEALVEKRHVWYETDPELAQQIREGWVQLEKDVAAYQPTAAEAKVEAEPIEALPALTIQVRGELALSSNLPVFREKADKYLSTVRYELATDEDFVNADAVSKFCGEVESALTQAKASMLAQTASVSEAVTVIDLYVARFAKARLDLGKKVTSEKQARKENILLKALADFNSHVAGLNIELAPLRISPAKPDFDAAARGLKTLTSMQAKVDAALAAGKIAADATAKDVRAKVAWMAEAAGELKVLFPDLQQLIAKPLEDFQLAIGTRIAQHKAAEAVKEESQRARIAAEEKAKADAAAAEATAAAVAAATAKAVEEERARAAEEKAAAAPAPAPEPAPAPAPAARQVVASFVRRAAPAPAPAPAPMTPPTLRIGDINERLGVLTTTASGLRTLGFEPATTKGAHGLYHERDWPLMLAKLVQHLEGLQAQAAA